jgi:hypothetical protein
VGALAGPAASPAPAGRPPGLGNLKLRPQTRRRPPWRPGRGALAAAGARKGSPAARPPALSGGGISLPLDEAGQLALT